MVSPIYQGLHSLQPLPHTLHSLPPHLTTTPSLPPSPPSPLTIDKDKYWDIHYPLTVLHHLLAHIPDLLRLLWPYMVATILFLIFVVVNGSIALGDKTHHTISFHVPQLFYFFAFTLSLSPSHLLDFRLARGFVAFLSRSWKRALCTLVVMVVLMGVSVRLFT